MNKANWLFREMIICLAIIIIIFVLAYLVDSTYHTWSQNEQGIAGEVCRANERTCQER